MKLSDWIAFSPLFTKCIGKLPLRHLLYLVRQLRYENPHKLQNQHYINTFFPAIPSAAFDRFLDAVIQQKRLPYSTYFAVTDTCPYRCHYCSYGDHQAGHLETHQAIEVIQQIKSIGTITIGFTGGEPLLRNDITDLVKATGDDVSTIMFTTGYGLDAEKAAKLKNSGLNCIIIGMESDDPDEHDGLRKVKGSFQTALRAIDVSLKAGLYVAISTVGTREKINTGTIENMTRLATQLDVHEFRILEPIPTGKLRGKKEQILSHENSQWLLNFHKRWNRANRGVTVASFAFLESDEMFGCGAGFHHLFIDALGNACPCDLTPLSFGNVLTESATDIWEKMGQYFDQPRCGCFMKEICEEIASIDPSVKFPLPPDESHRICDSHKYNSKLPKIWNNIINP